jgi:hypothetical protein
MYILYFRGATEELAAFDSLASFAGFDFNLLATDSSRKITFARYTAGKGALRRP